MFSLVKAKLYLPEIVGQPSLAKGAPTEEKIKKKKV